LLTLFIISDINRSSWPGKKGLPNKEDYPMTIVKSTVLALATVAALGVAMSPAAARRHQVCHMEGNHHHMHKVCHWVR
jgi:hypothetical protein